MGEFVSGVILVLFFGFLAERMGYLKVGKFEDKPEVTGNPEGTPQEPTPRHPRDPDHHDLR